MTQGIVSVFENNQVILKAVAGCDGYEAEKLARRIKAEGLRDAESVYKAAMEVGFGSEESLVVLDSERIYYPYGDNQVGPLYRQTFSNPKFNPRWQCGSVEDDCLAIVEL